MFDRLAPPLAFAGLAWSRGGRDHFDIQTGPGITANSDTLFRVASLTKITVGIVLERVMAAKGVAHPYHLDVRGFLPLPPNPHDVPAQPVTFGMLASHSAGLADMIVPPDVPLFDFLCDTPDVWTSSHGTRFAYSNLGFVVLAAALEAATGQRIDRLVSSVLDDLGIAGGLNWSGVAPADRRAALPTFRRDGDQFIAQIDAALPDAGIILSDGTRFDATHYAPGWNPAAFAPQGGLRTNLAGLLALAKSFSGRDHIPIWCKSDGPGEYLDGLFCDYGAGVQILPDPPFYPRPLIGHFGNAYGFNGGVWHDATADLSFAYALNGLEVGDESDALSDIELRIFDAMARLKG